MHAEAEPMLKQLPNRSEMDALLTDWHGQQWVDLPGHLRFLRRGGLLGFAPATGVGSVMSYS